MGGAVRQAD